jgi:DNA topoisomerase-2
MSDTSSTESKSHNIKFSIKKNTDRINTLDFEKQVIPKKSSIKSDVSLIYKKMSHVQHVLEKPDSYVGSTELEETFQDILDNSDNNEIKIIRKMFEYCPAFYKCYDELLVNAFDHSKRQKKKYEDGNKTVIQVSCIKVDINDDHIVVWNDGDGIDIELLPEHNIYPPELIFGKLLTSTNYDDNDQREWGGRNGYGAKLANIYSVRTEVETVDKLRCKKFKQIFTNNMSERTEPVITSCYQKPFTKLVWYPDFKRFNLKHFDENHIALFKKRVYDIAACTDKTINVFLNGVQIKQKIFSKYVDLYIGNKPRVSEENDGWSVIALDNNNDTFEQRSFVNGVNTLRGGKHVDYVVDQIKDKLTELIKKKRKINVKPAYVKNQLSIFVNSTIINPVFDGQTKETLKTNKTKFGHYIELSNKFIENLYKTDITEKIIQQTNYKENKNLQKTDGRKTTYIKVPKLSDANNAGTRKSKLCTLILTEGDSAKSMAIAGLSVVGRDNYGVFPLKGKILNVRDASNNEILKNIEINNIKKILGLQSSKNYLKEDLETSWPLRYGKIMIMTDQDLDGSHIKGLIINLFDSVWPLLLDQGFLCSMITPIVKARKGKKEEIFYTLQDYEGWKKKTNNGKGWKIKYYKGLGTSTIAEAKDYFKQLKVIDYFREDNIIEEHSKSIEKYKICKNKNTKIIDSLEQELCNKNKIDLAFRKDRADDRKIWLGNYSREEIPDFTKTTMSCNEFIDTELIHFSNYSNDRSIPNILDGLKPSTRKILFSCFKRNLTNEIKVAQLAGYVSENSGYHHGEKSLEGAIVGLAQDFVGSNNINLLEPIGQFGTRLLGGKDAAQSRYIFTKLDQLTKIIFNPYDEPLYNYLDDDGVSIEPESYCGILPMILVNGGDGIGTGFSTTIPCYNPIDIIKQIKNKINNKPYTQLIPWYRHFKGTITDIGNNSYITRGKYTKISSMEIRITELPIGVWTDKYIEFLDKCTIDKGEQNDKYFIRNYIDNSTESNIDILLRFSTTTLTKILIKPDINGISYIEKILKLTSKLNTGNMWLFNTQNKIHHYGTIYEIIDEWYDYRLDLYVKRKEYLLQKLKKELDIIKYKVMFIEEIINETLDIKNKSKFKVYETLKDKNYPELSSKIDDDDNLNYDYLLNMNFYKLTSEEIEKLKLEKQRKETDHDILYNTTEYQLWIDELDNFKNIYSKFIKPKKTLKIKTVKKNNKDKI